MYLEERQSAREKKNLLNTIVVIVHDLLTGAILNQL
jgi:hypothetical protein